MSLRSLKYFLHAVVPSAVSPSVPLIQSVTGLAAWEGRPPLFFRDQISMAFVCVCSVNLWVLS